MIGMDSSTCLGTQFDNRLVKYSAPYLKSWFDAARETWKLQSAPYFDIMVWRCKRDIDAAVSSAPYLNIMVWRCKRDFDPAVSSATYLNIMVWRCKRDFDAAVSLRNERERNRDPPINASLDDQFLYRLFVTGWKRYEQLYRPCRMGKNKANTFHACGC